MAGGQKTILIMFIYIKIIWYAPLLFQFKRIAKCILFIISWEMAHARIAFGSKIEPKMLPINKQIKTVMIYIHCSILNIFLKISIDFGNSIVLIGHLNSKDWKIFQTFISILILYFVLMGQKMISMVCFY